MEQKQFHIRLESEVASTIHHLSQQSGKPSAHVMEELIREALAAREEQRFPHILNLLHTVIHDEVERQNADLPALVAAAVQQAEQVRYHDITTLLIRAIHQAGLAWRLSYVALSLNVPEDHLKQIFADAEQRVLEQLQQLDIKGAE